MNRFAEMSSPFLKKSQSSQKSDAVIDEISGVFAGFVDDVLKSDFCKRLADFLI